MRFEQRFWQTSSKPPAQQRDSTRSRLNRGEALLAQSGPRPSRRRPSRAWLCAWFPPRKNRTGIGCPLSVSVAARCRDNPRPALRSARRERSLEATAATGPTAAATDGPVAPSQAHRPFSSRPSNGLRGHPEIRARCPPPSRHARAERVRTTPRPGESGFRDSFSHDLSVSPRRCLEQMTDSSPDLGPPAGPSVGEYQDEPRIRRAGRVPS